jgi:hypothetical protein
VTTQLASEQAEMIIKSLRPLAVVARSRSRRGLGTIPPITNWIKSSLRHRVRHLIPKGVPSEVAAIVEI